MKIKISTNEVTDIDDDLITVNNVFLKEMKEKSVTYYSLKLKTKKKAKPLPKPSGRG